MRGSILALIIMGFYFHYRIVKKIISRQKIDNLDSLILSGQIGGMLSAIFIFIYGIENTPEPICWMTLILLIVVYLARALRDYKGASFLSGS